MITDRPTNVFTHGEWEITVRPLGLFLWEWRAASPFSEVGGEVAGASASEAAENAYRTLQAGFEK